MNPQKKQLRHIDLQTNSQTLCSPFPTTGLENARLQFFVDGKKAFERSIYLEQDIPFDHVDPKAKQISGGHAKAQEILVKSFFPFSLILKKNVRVRLLALGKNDVLGEGDL